MSASPYLYLREAKDLRPGEAVTLQGDDFVRTVANVTRHREDGHDLVLVKYTNDEMDNVLAGYVFNVWGSICDQCASICDPDGVCPDEEFH